MADRTLPLPPGLRPQEGLAEEAARSAVRRQQAYANILDSTDASVARQARLIGRDLGISPSAVTADINGFREERNNRDAFSALGDVHVSNFVANPGNAAAVKDDLPTLSEMSAIFRLTDESRNPNLIQNYMKRTAPNGGLVSALNMLPPARRATLGAVDVSRDLNTKMPAPARERINGIRALDATVTGAITGAARGVETFLADAVGLGDTYRGSDYYKQTGQTVRELNFEAQDPVRRLEESDAPASVKWAGARVWEATQSLSILGASLASGNPIMALSIGTGAEQYNRVRSRGGSANEALVSGTVTGAAEGLFEKYFGLGWMLGNFGKKATSKFIGGLLLREVPSEMATTAVQDLADAMVTGGKGWEQYKADLPENLLNTAASTAIMVGAIGGVNHIARRTQPEQRSIEEIGRAAAGGEFVDRLMAAAEKSKVRQEDPETIREFVEARTEATPVRSLYVPVEAVAEYMQSEGYDGSLDRYQSQIAEAQATQGDVVIPVADAVAYLAGTPAWEALREQVRVEPGGLSRKEAQEKHAEIISVLEQRGKEIAAEAQSDATAASDSAEVYREVKHRLRIAGIDDKQADAVAQIYGARYEARAGRLGGTAMEQFKRSKISFPGETPGQYSESREVAQDAVLNIGLDIPGGGRLEQSEALKALQALGVEVSETEVRQSASEPTLIAQINRALTPEEAHTLSETLRQEAVVQYSGGQGGIYGPLKENWGEFNPDFFLMPSGRTLQQAVVALPDDEQAASAVGAYKVARSRKFKNIREFKEEVQRAVKSAKGNLRHPERLFRLAVADAEQALMYNRNAVGWYNEKVTQALAVLGQLQPEINTDPDARFAFVYALAVTSNGLRVDRNFQLALKVYRQYRESGTMPSIGEGTAQEAIAGSLNLFNTLVERFGSIGAVRDFMLTTHTVKELKALGFPITGENTGTSVLGAAILGPKIGNGFFGNLYGQFDQLTMDRWFLRTWGRWTGTLIEVDEAAVKRKRDELQALLRTMDTKERAAIGKILSSPRTQFKVKISDVEGFAARMSSVTVKKSVRDQLAALPNGDLARRVSQRLMALSDGQKEAPKNGAERNEIRAVMTDVLRELQRSEPALTMADLQALLWYPEKTLYETAVGSEETTGYADDDAPDYANAAVSLAKVEGLSERKINAAISEANAAIAANGAGRTKRGSRELHQDVLPEAGWTPERVSGLIDQYGREDGSSSVIAVMMSPAEYLALTASPEGIEVMQSTVEQDYGPFDPTLLDRSPPIMLTVARGGENDTRPPPMIRGHDGRHRMVMLQQAGFARVPVLVELTDKDGKTFTTKEPIRVSNILGNRSRGNPLETSRVADGIVEGVPVSWRFKEDLEEIYGRVLAQEAPPLGYKQHLNNEELIDYLIRNDDAKELYEEDPDEREEFEETLREILGDATASLRYISLEGLVFNGGYIDDEVVDHYASLTTDAPLILVRGNEIVDGNHRTTIMRQRGITHAWAYVVDTFREVKRLDDGTIILEYQPEGQDAIPIKMAIDDGVAEIAIDQFSTRANRLGPAKIREAMQDLLRMYPEIRTFGGYRRSGAGKGRVQEITLRQGPRGTTTVTNDGQHIIQLFATSNRSTLLHETGHIWLEELKADAAENEDAKRDYEIVKKWWKANGVDVGKSGFIPTEGHELFARGIERYFMEGKAPTQQLSGVFKTFRAWLLRIYQVVQNLRTPITPEIREVFDRLLATQAALEDAAAQNQSPALFKTAEEAGMTEAEFADYQQRITDARDEAYDTLLFKTMESIRKAKNAERREQRAAIRAEVGAEIASQPQFRLLHLLRTGRWLGDPDRPAVNVKLNSGWLIDNYGEDIFDKLPRGIQIWKGDGETGDVVAEMVGLASGTEVVQTLLGMRAASDALRAKGETRSMRDVMIEEEVERVMAERHGDPLNDGSIEEEAIAALNTARQGEIIGAEIRQLAKRKSVIGVPTPYQFAREWARRTVAAGNVRDVASRSALQRYTRAAAKSARLAEEAILAGDIDETYRQKQAQLLNHALLAEAKIAADNVDKIVNRMRKLAGRAAQSSIDPDYLAKIHMLLERYDFRPKSQKSIDEQEGFQQWLEQQRAKGFEVHIPPRLQNAGVNYTRVTVEELEALNDIVESLVHLGRVKQKLKVANAERDFAEFRDEVVARIKQLPDRRAKRERWWKSGKLVKNSPINEDERILAASAAELLKVETIVEELDGGPTGPLHDAIIVGSTNAENMRYALRERVLKPIAEAYHKIPRKQRKRLEERVTIPELTWNTLNEGDPRLGDNVTMTRMELLSVFLNMGNLSNLEKLSKGERWPVETLKAVINRELTKEDMDFAQTLWDQVDTLWPDIVRVEGALSGVVPEKVIEAPIVTPHGEYKGGYWPVVYDAARWQRAEDIEGQRLDDMFGIKSGVATQKGHTITRTAAFGPINLNLENVLFQHIEQVVTRIAFAEYARDVLRIIKDRPIRGWIDTKLGPEYRKQVEKWLARQVHEGAVHAKAARWWDRTLKQARINVTIAAMGLRFSTGVAQTLGLTASAQRIGAKWVGVGMKRMLTPGSTAFAYARSPEILHRTEAVNREVAELSAKMRGKHSWWTNAQSWAMWHIGMIDRYMVALPTWLGAHAKGISEGMTDEEASAYADKSVRLSQGAGREKDLSAIQSPNSEAMRFFTMFYTPFNVMFNAQWQGVRDLKKGDPRTMIGVTFWWLMASTLGDAFLSGDWPEEEEGETQWIEWFGRNVFFGLFAGIPLARDFANYAERKMIGEYASEAGTTPINRIAQATEKAWKVGTNAYEGEDITNPIKQGGDITAVLLGMPTSQVGTTAQFAWDVHHEETNPETVSDWYFGITRGKTRSEEENR